MQLRIGVSNVFLRSFFVLLSFQLYFLRLGLEVPVDMERLCTHPQASLVLLVRSFIVDDGVVLFKKSFEFELCLPLSEASRRVVLWLFLRNVQKRKDASSHAHHPAVLVVRSLSSESTA